MKKLIVCLLPALVLLLASPVARADQFTEMQNSPKGYWVPSPTPPPPFAYYGPPPGYYGGPYPYGPYDPYYGPRYHGPRVFLGFGFRFH